MLLLTTWQLEGKRKTKGVGSLQPQQDVRIHYFWFSQNGGVLISLIVSIWKHRLLPTTVLQKMSSTHAFKFWLSGHTQDHTPNCTFRVQPHCLTPSSDTDTFKPSQSVIQGLHCGTTVAISIHQKMLLRQALQLQVFHMNESFSTSLLQLILTLANCLKVILIRTR